MIVAALVVLVVSVVFAWVCPRLGRRLPPAVATRVLVPASLAVAAATGFVLAVAAFTLVGQLPEIAEAGQWSVQAVREADPVPPSVAVFCGVLVILAAGRAIRRLTRRIVAFARIQRDCRAFDGADVLVVIDSDRLDAFATPGVRGRIVVTTGLLRALSVEERRAVLAHERSHLVHRHAWWVLAVDLAAAANPLLGPTARTVAHAVERWADEDAADVVADRRSVARAVGRAALLRHRANRRPVVVCSAIGGDVPGRVRAMLEPKPRPRLRHLAALGALLLLMTAGSGLVQERCRELFVQASVALHPE